MMKSLKKIIKSNPRLDYVAQKLMDRFLSVRGNNNYIDKNGYLIHCKTLVVGNNNRIIIENGTIIKNTLFHIYGDNNEIRIEKDVTLHEEGSSLWIDGDSNKIIIGRNTSIRSAHLCAQEINTCIEIGSNCMLSNTIEIRTSDSHAIYDRINQRRINPAKSVKIEDKVWISAKVVIMKGVTIRTGSIVGYGSLVTKDVPPNSLVAGRPAKLIKENIFWTKELPSNESVYTTITK